MLSRGLRVSQMLRALGCASPVRLAVLIKHISGRWLQLKDRFTDDTVQKDVLTTGAEERACLQHYAPSVTGQTQLCQGKLERQLARLAHL